MARFKKGSKAAKDFMRKLRNSKSSSIKRKSPIKLKEKKVVKKRRKRRSVSTPRRSFRRKNVKSMLGLGSLMVGSIAYGAIRGRMSDALAPVTARIPLGSVSDEVGMIIALSLAKKFVGNKVPLLKQAASAGIYIELARIGEELASGNLSFGGVKAEPKFTFS